MALNTVGSGYPDAFYQLVKQVLENFYDFPYLNRHTLAKMVQAPRLRSSETDGQRLRRIFSTAIENLKPAGEAEERSIYGRYFRLLQLRYVDSNTMQEVARLLGVSERQAYRDLKRAEESLASDLWAQFGSSLEAQIDGLPKSEEQAEPPTGPEAAAGELNELVLHMTGVNIYELLKNAQKAVERLAEQRNIHLEILATDGPTHIYSDPSFAQQMLISILSSMIQNVATDRIQIWTESAGNSLRLIFAFEPQDNYGYALPHGPVIDMLVERLNWKIHLDQPAGATNTILDIYIPLQESVLLVIDDNNALIELLRRYLTQTRCQVVGVNDGLQGMQMAQSLKPDAILLDIMMPNIDGWEILQRLRANPETSHVSVIVCSIFHDPELARSLGAAHTLSKPVNRNELLQLLSQLRLI